MLYPFFISSIRILGLTTGELVEAAKGNPSAVSQTTTPIDNMLLALSSILFVVAIVLAMLFVKNATSSISHKKEFNGTAWGAANGACGLGILFAIVAVISVNKEIAKVKDKKYAKYAKDQVKRFILAYFICALFWIFIAVARLSSNH